MRSVGSFSESLNKSGIEPLLADLTKTGVNEGGRILVAPGMARRTMSYVLEQTEALIAVLEQATRLVPHRLAAYAVNAEFWASEVHHCHELLDGYVHRWERMRQATEDYLREQPLSPDQQDSDTRTTRGTKDSELRAARHRLDEAAQRFFLRFYRAGLLSDERRSHIESLLGYELHSH